MRTMLMGVMLMGAAVSASYVFDGGQAADSTASLFLLRGDCATQKCEAGVGTYTCVTSQKQELCTNNGTSCTNSFCTQ
jgi:hypothetical protein